MFQLLSGMLPLCSFVVVCSCIVLHGTGGVKKELFQLLVGMLFDASYGMFVRLGQDGDDDVGGTSEESSDAARSGVLFFNRGCTWSAEEYQVIHKQSIR